MAKKRTVALNPDRLGFGVEEAGRHLGISRDATFKLIASGALRSFRIGRRRLVSREAVADYIRAAEAVEAASPTRDDTRRSGAGRAA